MFVRLTLRTSGQLPARRNPHHARPSTTKIRQQSLSGQIQRPTSSPSTGTPQRRYSSVELAADTVERCLPPGILGEAVVAGYSATPIALPPRHEIKDTLLLMMPAAFELKCPKDEKAHQIAGVKIVAAGQGLPGNGIVLTTCGDIGGVMAAADGLATTNLRTGSLLAPYFRHHFFYRRPPEGGLNYAVFGAGNIAPPTVTAIVHALSTTPGGQEPGRVGTGYVWSRDLTRAQATVRQAKETWQRWFRREIPGTLIPTTDKNVAATNAHAIATVTPSTSKEPVLPVGLIAPLAKQPGGVVLGMLGSYQLDMAECNLHQLSRLGLPTEFVTDLPSNPIGTLNGIPEIQRVRISDILNSEPPRSPSPGVRAFVSAGHTAADLMATRAAAQKAMATSSTSPVQTCDWDQIRKDRPIQPSGSYMHNLGHGTHAAAAVDPETRGVVASLSQGSIGLFCVMDHKGIPIATRTWTLHAAPQSDTSASRLNKYDLSHLLGFARSLS